MKTKLYAKNITMMLLASLFPLSSMAGFGAHGGNSVVCFDDPSIPKAIRAGTGEILDQYIPHVTSVETFDLYEARKCQGLGCSVTPQLISVNNGEAPFEYVERIATRFDGALAVAAEIIRNSAKRFPQDHIFMENHGLKKVDDTNEVSLIDSVNCVLGTVATQIDSGPDTYLYVDSRLYNHPKHTPFSKAVLILHETVYYRDRQHGVKDSRDTRLRVAKAITYGPTLADYVNMFAEGNAGAADVYKLIADIKGKIVEASQRQVRTLENSTGDVLLSSVNKFLDSVKNPSFFLWNNKLDLDTDAKALDLFLTNSSSSSERKMAEEWKQKILQYMSLRTSNVVNAAKNEYLNNWQAKVKTIRYAPESFKQALDQALLNVIDNEFPQLATTYWYDHTDFTYYESVSGKKNGFDISEGHREISIMKLGNDQIQTPVRFDLGYVVGP